LYIYRFKYQILNNSVTILF
jgi:hypothetical protein